MHAARQEVEVAQQTGLHAIAEALMSLSEQNVMMHNQTQAIMSRLLLSPAVLEEFRLNSEHTSSDSQWAATGDVVTPRRQSQSPQRQGPY